MLFLRVFMLDNMIYAMSGWLFVGCGDFMPNTVDFTLHNPIL
jgi:hypothetical protein